MTLIDDSPHQRAEAGGDGFLRYQPKQLQSLYSPPPSVLFDRTWLWTIMGWIGDIFKRLNGGQKNANK